MQFTQSLNDLARFYDNQGRYNEAEPLYLQALELRKRLVGEEQATLTDEVAWLLWMLTEMIHPG